MFSVPWSAVKERASYLATSSKLHPKFYCSKTVCMWRIVCAGTHVCGQVEARDHPRVSFIRYQAPYFFETGFLIGLKLTKWARLDDQRAPSIHLSIPPQPRDYSC